MPIKKVLLADDDAVLVETLATVLRAKRIRVARAADAMQAVMFAVKELPDAVVLDIGMPGGTGRTALQKLHENRKTALIPVLVLTGQSDPELPAFVKSLGAAYMHKPARPADVVQVLEEIVERRASLIEQVFDSLKGTSVPDLAAELGRQGRETNEAELAMILDYLKARGRAAEKDGHWFIA